MTDNPKSKVCRLCKNNLTVHTNSICSDCSERLGK